MTTNTNNPTGKYASVNGINLYYEIHGTGKPLIMLHGGFGTFEMFTALSPALALDHQVIGVDLYGHGRTAITDRPIRFEQMADDIASLIHHLGLEKADLLGYSLGGGLKDAGWNGEHLIPSQLAILPGATHYNIFFRADLLLPVLSPFLDRKQAMNQ